jgi:hypothetical protein
MNSLWASFELSLSSFCFKKTFSGHFNVPLCLKNVSESNRYPSGLQLTQITELHIQDQKYIFPSTSSWTSKIQYSLAEHFFHKPNVPHCRKKNVTDDKLSLPTPLPHPNHIHIPYTFLKHQSNSITKSKLNFNNKNYYRKRIRAMKKGQNFDF